MEQNIEDKHWRDVQESEFLASWDFVNPKETLTILEVRNEYAQLQKKELKVVAHFKETHLSCGTKTKPMILNATNSKEITNQTKLRHQRLWKNIQVEISVMVNNSKIGGKEKLVITKATQLTPFDINDILKITDIVQARKLATENSGRMTAEEIDLVKKHLETLKTK